MVEEVFFGLFWEIEGVGGGWFGSLGGLVLFSELPTDSHPPTKLPPGWVGVSW